jgi:hypothetical protein
MVGARENAAAPIASAAFESCSTRVVAATAAPVEGRPRRGGMAQRVQADAIDWTPLRRHLSQRCF